MPTEIGDLLSNGILYLQDEDGTTVPFTGLAETTLLGCTEGTINYVGDIPVIREMTFSIPLKRPTRAVLRAAGCRTRRRSMRAINRPIRRIMRLKEKARRYILKNGIDKKIIAHYKKYMEEENNERK